MNSMKTHKVINNYLCIVTRHFMYKVLHQPYDLSLVNSFLFMKVV